MSTPDPATRAPLRVYVFPGQQASEDTVRARVEEDQRWRRIEIIQVQSVADFETKWKGQNTSYADFMLTGHPATVTSEVLKYYNIEVI